MTEQEPSKILRRQYTSLWNGFMKRLRNDHLLSRVTAWWFDHQKLELLDRLVDHGPFEGIPFLPVIPFSWCDSRRQGLAANGTDHMNAMPFPHTLADRETVPPGPYFMLDVRLGDAITEEFLPTAVNRLKYGERRPLTLAETFALILHAPHSLHGNDLVAAGSGSITSGRGRKIDADLLLRLAKNGSLEVVEIGEMIDQLRPRIPTCRTALDPNTLWADATDEEI